MDEHPDVLVTDRDAKLGARFAAAFEGVGRAGYFLHPQLAPAPSRLVVASSMVPVLVRFVAGFARLRVSLVAENEMLRLQLAAAKARLRGKRLRFTPSQRWLIGALVTVTAGDGEWQLVPGGPEGCRGRVSLREA